MYFAVKKTLLIGNRRHIPCVCYELTNELKPTVEELVKKGWAYTDDKYMVFESGKRIDNVKKPVSKKSSEKAGF